MAEAAIGVPIAGQFGDDLLGRRRLETVLEERAVEWSSSGLQELTCSVILLRVESVHRVLRCAAVRSGILQRITCFV
jgi:hypothetical protein